MLKNQKNEKIEKNLLKEVKNTQNQVKLKIAKILIYVIMQMMVHYSSRT